MTFPQQGRPADAVLADLEAKRTDDVRWRDAAVAACASRVTLLGVHLVTVEGSRLVPGRWPLPASGGSLADAS